MQIEHGANTDKIAYSPRHRKGGRHTRVTARPERPPTRHTDTGPLRIAGGTTHDIAHAAISGLPDVGSLTQVDKDSGAHRVGQAVRKLERREVHDQLEKAGCVIRAAESAFNAKASVPEIEDRLVDVRNLKIKFESGDVSYEDLRTEDIRLAKEYYERIKTRESSLGKVMRDYAISVKEMTKEEMQQAISDGSKVLASTRIRYGNTDVQHLMHVDYFSSTGRLAAVSDEHPIEITAPSYLCYVFEKTPE